MIHHHLKEHADIERRVIKDVIKSMTDVEITDAQAYDLLYTVILDLDHMRASRRKDGKRNKEVVSQFLNDTLDSIYDNIEELRR